MTDLHKLRILVTRPDPQGQELCREIAARGGVPIHFPTIAFLPPPNLEAYQSAIRQLDKQDWLIFISPQSVYASIASINKSPTVQIAAIGSGTAKALEQAGFTVNLIPEKEENSEGLLKLPALQQVSGKKIAIIRGAGGRELIDKTLAERGAKVLSVIAYQRGLPDVDITDCIDRVTNHEVDVIICTSFEGVRNLRELLGESTWSNLQKIPLIVISERIKLLAEDLGFRRIWVTRHSDVLAEIRGKI